MLSSCLDALSTDTTIRSLFLRSTIAGADLKYMKDLSSPAEAREFIMLIDSLCRRIQDFRVPVIAVISGPCLGAGMEVAASCDLRIGIRDPMTIFGMPETKVGIPSVVQASLIPGLVGWGRARELLYFGEHISCEKALEWGFLNAIVEKKEIENVIEQWEIKINQTGPRALSNQKKLMRTWEEAGTSRRSIEAGVDAFGDAFCANEPRKMIEKFFQDNAARKRNH